MIKINTEKIKLYIQSKSSSRIIQPIICIYKVLYGFSLFLATLTGYIPSHMIRQFLYRRLFKVKMSKDTIIYWRSRFFCPSGVNIGHNSIIGNDAFLDGRGGLYIGNNVNIGGEVRIYTAEHDITSPTFAGIIDPVYIKDWVYIGARVIILPGVTIEEGAVVASGAVVTKNVDPWIMVGGIPAKYIKKRPVVKYTLNTQKKTFFQ